MPLNEQLLGEGIFEELSKEFPIGDRDINPDDRRRAANALAKAIVDHLRKNALVNTPTGPGTIV